MPTCPDCGEPVAGDERRCPACGAALADGDGADASDIAADTSDIAADATDAVGETTGDTATVAETATDDLSARAAGARVADEEYMAPPGEWTPPDAAEEPGRERPAVEPLDAAPLLAWAARALADRPVALAPAAIAGLAAGGAAGAAYGLVGPPAVFAPAVAPLAVALAAAALAASVPGVAAAALVAEAAVAADSGSALASGSGKAPADSSGDGRALLRRVVPRLRAVGAAALGSAALTFTGYVFFVIPGAIIGPKVSLAPHAAAIDGTGPVESVERSWRRTRGRFATVAGVWAAATVAALVPFAVAPAAGALVAPLAAAVGGVALGRVYLEGE